MRRAQRPDGAEGERARITYLTPALWSRLLDARTADEFSGAWLALQCGMIEHATRGLVALVRSDGSALTPAAHWPEGRPATPALAAAAEAAVKQGEGVIHAQPGDSTEVAAQVGYPILIDDRIHGVVAVSVEACPRDELQAVVHQLQWGTAQIEASIRRFDADTARAAVARISAALDAVTAAVSLERLEESASAIVSTLAARTGAARASLGLLHEGSARVIGISGRSEVDARTQLARNLGAAMEEVALRAEPVVLPRDDAPPRAHRTLAAATHNPALVSVPLRSGSRVVAALLLERDRPFPDETLAVCETVGQVLGPLLEARRREARPWWQRLREEALELYRTWLGPQELTARLVAGALAAVVLFLVFAKADYRVDARTVLEASVQRVIAAPFDGYVADAQRSAGDRVEQGEVLARLDERELQLDRLRWERERARFRKQLQQGRAARDRVQMELARAQIAQTEAQIALLEERLSRAELRAPFDGMVLDGDLSQSLGAPVRRGETLFEIAPLEGYRVMLQVDERDVAAVAEGQRGSLQLNSLPGELFEFEVVKTTPVASAEEGLNYFRVEGRLDEPSASLRPGMEGVAKVVVGRRNLVWIWTHSLIDWLRLTFWEWTP